MTQLALRYGGRSLDLDYDETRFRVLAPEEHARHPLSDAEIGAAIDAPIGSPPLEEIISAGESVLLIVSDATRATASAQLVHLLVRRLIALGVAPSDIQIIFATGIHRAVTPEEKRELLTPFIVRRIKTLDHNASDEKQLIRLGQTERGTPVELNRALKEHTHVILTGAVGFHYFAGFTGGRKSICPGLASARTIEATHMLALDFERGGRRAGVGAGLLEGNPVHEECERIAALVAPSFLVNALVDEHGRAARLYAGDWREAHALACLEYQQEHSVRLEAKREVVIVGGGGAPWDINLIQAHKALEMAAQAVSEGGTIILVAECAEGLGRADFLKWFDAVNSRALENNLRERYEVTGQTAWSLLLKAERFRIFLISSLAPEDVQKMRMTPARTIEEALVQTGGAAEGYIMPRGAAVLPLIV
ncbi:MAG TPA: nickel-dependent lactate racemase [Pyrinomonadaceae bacterium]|jgi:nickel-dependent lactate racemase